MNQRTTVRLPEKLLNRARRKASAEGRTLTSLIEEGLESVLAEKRSGGNEKRVLPRISKASGGSMPGIDLSDLSEFQELEDLEYLARMKRFK